MSKANCSEDFKAKCKIVFDECNGGDACEITQLNAVLTERFPDLMKIIDIVETFRVMDTSGDKAVTWDEFLTEMSKFDPRKIQEATLRAVFAGLDTDGSGLLNKEEMRTALQELGTEATDEQLDEMFAKADPDGNGINVDEFILDFQNSAD